MIRLARSLHLLGLLELRRATTAPINSAETWERITGMWRGNS